MSDEQTNLAQVKDLSVSFMTDAGSIKAIDKISFTIPRKTVVGVVGESGSGKSVTARSIIKLLPETATTSGVIYLSNREGNEQLDVLSLSGEDLRRMRGSEAAMVFQEPNSVLNPVYTIGWQIEEGLRAHGMKDKKELRAKSVDILKKVGIPDAETRIDYYPHQFSGGQKQRIVIAMALVLNPGLILADEPTTALDVTVQAEILDLLRLARDEFGASVLIITHNMGVIADIADEVVVMYRGHVVEQGSVEQIFYSPKDDYTKRLLAAVPRIGQKLVVRDEQGKVIERSKDWHDQPIAVEAKGLTITYPGHLTQPDFKAVNGIDFTIHRSEVLGLVGESGSGKSVSAMSILRLLDGNGYIDSGEILFNGQDLTKLSMNEMYKIRGNEISVIFQEPMTSLNPVFTVSRQISEPLMIHQGMNKKQAAAKAVELLSDVKIPNPEVVAKQYPHQLSGGMRQRVMIAMALACRPKLLIADEPTTALDVTIQAQILKLMNELREKNGTAVLFITHDLGVINQMADNVAVMYCGQVVEYAPAGTIFHKNEYSHPYTEGLMLSIPRLDTPSDERLEAIPGAVPHPLDLPKGCKFAPRCKYATERCLEEEPELIHVSDTQQVRCFYAKKEDRHAK